VNPFLLGFAIIGGYYVVMFVYDRWDRRR